MVSNRKFSKVYDLVAKFEKKASNQVASVKQAQVMSSAEQEATLKRDIEDLMTKGVSSTVRPVWQKLVSVVTQLKTSKVLPAGLDALAYYQVIVHGGVAYDRRVKFTTAFPKVVMDLAILASEQNVTNDDAIINLSKALNGPCDSVKAKYEQLVKLQDSNKTERDRNDFEPRDSAPKEVTQDGRTLSLEQATQAVKGMLRELSVDGSRDGVMQKFNASIRPVVKQFAKDPDFNKSVRALTDALFSGDSSKSVLDGFRRRVSALSGLRGDAKLAKGYQLVNEMLEKAPTFKGNPEFSQLVTGVVDDLSDVSDTQLNGQLNALKMFT